MKNIRRFAILAALAAIFLLFACAGCTPKRVFNPGLSTPSSAWKEFLSSYGGEIRDAGILVNASLYYTRVSPTRRSNRTVLRMWGDLDLPLRLDVSAGIGRILAHIREDRGGLTAYYPESRAAYTHENPVLGATRLGMPFPFALKDLAHVLAGSFASLVPKNYENGTRTGKGYVFTFAQGPVAVLELDGWARPVRMEGTSRIYNGELRGWSVEFDRYPEEGAGVPQAQMLILAMDNGEKGVLRVKKRELRSSRWPEKSMEMLLPEGTALHRMDMVTIYLEEGS